jgi:hypothetical protein
MQDSLVAFTDSGLPCEQHRLTRNLVNVTYMLRALTVNSSLHCALQTAHAKLQTSATACRKREAQLEAQISQKARCSAVWDQQLQPQQAAEPVRPWATSTLGYASEDEEVR